MSETTGCKKCKQKKASYKQIGIIIFGFYVIFATCVGTVKIFETIVNFFK
jgi:hypothetical protein